MTGGGETRPSASRESPGASPAPARDASTVVLVRDGAAGIEVFLQRRVRQMAFAGGMTVFPGGGVDERDSDADIAWTGPSPEWWAQRFGTDVPRIRALVCAAVRETFEECGVLLAGSESAVHPEPQRFAAERAALVAKELSLSRFLADNDLMLRADLLHPLAHWITPAAEPRRYDTRFFLAELPAGHHADGETGEASETLWRTASGALDDWRTGRHFLLPPTWAQLRRISGFGTVAELAAADFAIEPIEPELPDAEPGSLLRIGFEGSDEYLAALADGRLSTF